MKLVSVMRVNSRIPEVRREGAGFAREFADILGEETVKKARRNVSPGKGPGPHPHRPQSMHEDTGDLRDSIKHEVANRGFMTEAFVSTDIDYGTYLEVGWTTVAGTHYRYPWLYPAALEASHEWQSIARSTAARHFQEDGSVGSRAGRIGIASPISATWLPEMG